MMKLSDIAKTLKTELHGCDQEFSGVSIDSRSLQKGNFFIALKGENFDGHDYIAAAAKAGAVGALVNKLGSYPLPTLLVPDTHQALIAWATQHRQQFNIPVIAITGSCGKTTTRALADSIFSLMGNTLASKSSFNNAIGLPLTLLQLSAEHQYAIQEVGANHGGEITHLMQILKPTLGVITCAAPVHIEGFGSLDGVAKAKAEIYEALSPEGIALLNVDDQYADFWRERIQARRTISFGIKHPAEVQAQAIKLDAEARPRFTLKMGQQQAQVQLQLMGEHNVLNALVAAATAHAYNIPFARIVQGLESAQTEKRRLQAKAGIKEARVIDDSYNANPTAMLAALKILYQHAPPRVFVVGDMRELGSDAERYHTELGQQARACEVEALYCFGPLSKSAATAFGANSYWFEDMTTLIEHLQNNLQQGSTVLVKGSNSLGMDRVVKALTV